MTSNSKPHPALIPGPWQLSMPWLWIAIAIGFLFFLCASPIVGVSIWSGSNAAEVRRLTAEIKAKGEPVTPSQLSEDFEIPQGYVDVGPILLDAMAPLSTGAFKERTKSLPFLGYEFKDPDPKLGEPWPELEEAEQFLKSCEFSLSKIDKAVELGGYARFSFDYSKGPSTQLPQLQDSRMLTRLLMLEFEVKAHRKDITGATKALRALFMVSRCCRQEPMMVAQLVGSAQDRVAMKSLADKLCLMPFDERDLREFRAIIQAAKPIDSLRAALLGERVLGLAGMQNMQLIDAKLPAEAAMSSDASTFLTYMTKYIAAIDRGFPDAILEVEGIDIELKQETTRMLEMTTKMTKRLLVPNSYIITMFDVTARDLATNYAADAGIAVELYRREHGSLPKSLDDLVPKYLPSVPLDPYRGAPMLYKVDESGFTIYSVGGNKVDDNGKVENQIKDVGLFFPLK